MNDKKGEKDARGEIIPPDKSDSPNLTGNIYAEIAAQINQYTDRPDLLLEVIEKHDPGFIKGMNDEARAFSRRHRLSRFRFGRFQAYTGLVLAVAVALGILYIIYTLAQTGQLSFWALLGFAILYAVTQSGPSGFMKIVSQITHLVQGKSKKDE